MPRLSAEARSADLHRVGGNPPPVPADLSAEAAVVWREVTQAKPADWFDGAALGLLRQFCRTMARAERVATEVEARAVADDEKETKVLERRLVALNGSCTTLATKLRISVQNRIDRKSGVIDEKGDADADPYLAAGRWACGRRSDRPRGGSGAGVIPVVPERYLARKPRSAATVARFRLASKVTARPW